MVIFAEPGFDSFFPDLKQKVVSPLTYAIQACQQHIQTAKQKALKASRLIIWTVGPHFIVVFPVAIVLIIMFKDYQQIITYVFIAQNFLLMMIILLISLSKNKHGSITREAFQTDQNEFDFNNKKLFQLLKKVSQAHSLSLKT